MNRVRAGVVAAGLVAAAGVAVLVSVSGPVTAVPAAPPSATETVEYGGYRYDPRDPEVARRLAAGEDPATIPGVVVTPEPLMPSALGTDPGGQESDAGAGTPAPR